MEVSMHMINHKLPKTVIDPLTMHKSKPMQMISCQLAMQSHEKTNFYQLLSLNSQNVGFDEIKKAYKSMALRYHPDVCAPNLTKEESTKRFIELRKAYETLSDPNSRRVYDYELGLDHDPFLTRFGCVEIKRNKGDNFPREVWERQLSGLRKKVWRKNEDKEM